MGLFPIYNSVDIRDSGFKAAVVDTNLFPAGYNNLDPRSHALASTAFHKAILAKVPQAKEILIIAEEHTRNKWYLQHLKTLMTILETAGFSVKAATFLNPKVDSICSEHHHVILECADGTPITLLCLHFFLDQVEKQHEKIDFILYNNDLSSGLPERLKTLPIPCAPSPLLGWYNRSKTRHFKLAQSLIEDWATTQQKDPWLYSTYFSGTPKLSINSAEDCTLMADLSSQLFEKIKQKYTEYKIETAPRLFIKADNGTYGMGVLSISDPKDILELNRKARNSLSKGKSAVPISHFLIQEGIPTRYQFEGQTAEPCLYLVEDQIVGAFYRCNSQKSEVENLNSQGMTFSPIFDETDSLPYPQQMTLYYELARLSAQATLLEEQEMQ